MKIDWSKVNNRERLLSALQIMHKCEMCGTCCGKNMAGIAMNSADVVRMAKQLDMSRTDFVRLYTVPSKNRPTDRWLDSSLNHGSCPFLTEHGCSQYDGRGQVCRLYPYTAPEQLDSAKAEKPVRVYSTCKGMKKAYIQVLKLADMMPPETAAAILTGDYGKYCVLRTVEDMYGYEAAKYTAREIGLDDVVPADRLYHVAMAFATAYCTQIPKRNRENIIRELETL